MVWRLSPCLPPGQIAALNSLVPTGRMVFLLIQIRAANLQQSEGLVPREWAWNHGGSIQRAAQQQMKSFSGFAFTYSLSASFIQCLLDQLRHCLKTDILPTCDFPAYETKPSFYKNKHESMVQRSQTDKNSWCMHGLGSRNCLWNNWFIIMAIEGTSDVCIIEVPL